MYDVDDSDVDNDGIAFHGVEDDDEDVDNNGDENDDDVNNGLNAVDDNGADNDVDDIDEDLPNFPLLLSSIDC